MGEDTKPHIHHSLANLRENYTRAELVESSVAPNPIAQFETWFSDACNSQLKEPNAMTLATASQNGQPSARIVLLKEFGDDGFVFFTSYESRKAQELDRNPLAALVFYWAELERQVRVEGTVHRTSRDQTERYFRTRPKGSRLGALASHQSAVVPSRNILENRLQELEARYYATDDVPVPELWGGYCLPPHTIEFWQGRPNRLHDRLRYTRTPGHSWHLDRLSP
ncbi:MAG: pyridoxamine 5'-phosphate oxidase [Bryobacteraceae bacterium]